MAAASATGTDRSGVIVAGSAWSVRADSGAGISRIVEGERTRSRSDVGRAEVDGRRVRAGLLDRPLTGARLRAGLRRSDRHSLDERDFERELRVWRVLDGEVDLAKSACQRGQLREGEHRRQLTSTCVRVACAARSFDQEHPKIGQKLPVELTGVFAIVDRVLDHAQGLAGVTAPERRDEPFNAIVPAQAERRGNVGDGDRHGALILTRDCRTQRQLLEQTKCVTQATGGMAGDQPKRVGVDRYALERRDGLQAANDVVGADAPEVEPLAAGDDRRKEFLRVGGGEDETGVCGRLLQRLEEGVCGRAGDLVRLRR